MATEKAILAGGCFWGMQEMFRSVRGVACQAKRGFDPFGEVRN